MSCEAPKSQVRAEAGGVVIPVLLHGALKSARMAPVAYQAPVIHSFMQFIRRAHAFPEHVVCTTLECICARLPVLAGNLAIRNAGQSQVCRVVDSITD